MDVTKTREWQARAKLGQAVEARKHLECMVLMWSRKLEEVQGHLTEAKANLERWTREEATLREQIPAIAASEREERRAALQAEMQRVKEEMARLEASEL